ncbi:MAG: hypothetical protein V3T14_05460 [Myxococcota bacterium]
MAERRDLATELVRLLEAFLRAAAESAAQVQPALRAEAARWKARASDDPAAARVHEVFLTLLEILEPPEKPDPPPARSGTRGKRRR